MILYFLLADSGCVPPSLHCRNVDEAAAAAAARPIHSLTPSVRNVCLCGTDEWLVGPTVTLSSRLLGILRLCRCPTNLPNRSVSCHRGGPAGEFLCIIIEHPGYKKSKRTNPAKTFLRRFLGIPQPDKGRSASKHTVRYCDILQVTLTVNCVVLRWHLFDPAHHSVHYKASGSITYLK